MYPLHTPFPVEEKITQRPKLQIKTSVEKTSVKKTFRGLLRWVMVLAGYGGGIFDGVVSPY